MSCSDVEMRLCFLSLKGTEKKKKSGQTAEFQLAADYNFIAGRH